MSGKDVLPMYQQYCIASSDEKEIKFLYGLLNSNLSLFLLEKTFKVGNEDKLTYILGLTFVKEFIHIPSITTQNNAIKEEIIKQTDHLLSQENLKLKDLIEFTTNQQRFSAVEVSSNNIVLFDRDGNETRQRIRLKPELVKSLLEEKYGKECIREKEIPLHDLKYIRAIDHNEQNRIKDYINDLVFALYFNISLNKIGLNEAEHIKELCRANKYYSYIHTVL
jgi:hypothetical protein